MSRVLHLGEIIAMNAQLFPDKPGGRDLTRSMTFRQWNDRACRLANALIGMGLGQGERIAVLAYNCLEWLEIYTAVAKAGLVAVPVNFRLVGPEIRYIVENAEAAAIIVQDELLASVEAIRADLPLASDRYIHFGAEKTPVGYRSYEDLIAGASPSEPSRRVEPSDPFALLYTSGTTGKPKGAIRSHESLVLHSYINQVDFGFGRDDLGLLVMPMCHANSIFFMFAFATCGAACCVYDRKHFDPEHLVRTLAGGRFTFTSLVPTHYIMMLGLPEQVKRGFDVDSITKLLISSAPARRETKLALMEYFRNSRLYEGYGSTEMGWVTFLRPEEQLTKLGSIGREATGTGRIKLLDAFGDEVADGEARRDLCAHALRVPGILEAAGEDGGGLSRGLLHGRRHRPARRRRLPLSRRPQEQHDHQRRRERLPLRSRAGPRRQSQDQGRRGHRRPRPEMGRGGPCRRHSACRREHLGGRHPRMVQGQDRRLQAAEIDLVHRRGRHAEDRHRQDTSSGAARPLRRAQRRPRAREGHAMNEATKANEALSGVVMGKTAGALLAGDGAAPSAETAEAKLDGGELVGRVLAVARA